MATELSSVLGHIEKIGELDLDDVRRPPTSSRSPTRCAPTSRAVPAARGRARAGPRRRRTTASSSRARRRMSADVIDASPPSRPPTPSRAGDLDADRAVRGLPRQAAADELNAYTWVADEAPEADGATARRWPACRSRSRTCSAPRASRASPARGSSRATGRPTPPRSSQQLPPPARRCWARPTRTSSRWARRTRTPRFGPVLNPWDRTRVPGGSSAAAAPRPSPPAARRGRWAPTPAARSASPPRCAASSGSSRPTARSRRYGMIAFASSLDQAGPLTRDVTDAALLYGHMVGPRPDATRPRCSIPRRSRCRPPSASTASASACPEELTGEGIEPGVLRALRGDAEARRGARRDGRARRAAARRVRPQRLLRDRAGRGVVEPRALRRRALRPARRGRRPAVDVHPDAPRRLRRRGQAPDHARDLRAVLAATTTPTTAARSACARRSPRTSRTRSRRSTSSSRPTAPTVAFELGAKTADPLAMYLNDFFTVPISLAGIPAISIPAGLSEGLPVGFQLAGPAFSENRMLDAAYALEQAHRLRRDGREGLGA